MAQDISKLIHTDGNNYEIEIRPNNNILVRCTTSDDKSEVYQLKSIHKFYEAQMKLFHFYFDGSYQSLENLIHTQKYLSNYTDFRVYEYIRLSGGIDKLLDSDWYSYDDKSIKVVYFGDILIVMCKWIDNIIYSDIRILSDSHILYRQIAKLINNNIITGEIAIDKILSISKQNNVSVLENEMPRGFQVQGGYVGQQVKQKEIVELSLYGAVQKVTIYKDYSYIPLKKINGIQQSEVTSNLRNIIL